MVVEQVNIMRVSVCEAEGDSPIPAHGDRPNSLLVSLQFVQAPSRANKIERTCSGIEHSEDVGNAVSEGGINEARLALLEHLLEPLVAEAPDHASIVR
jgi:hypothetical protein